MAFVNTHRFFNEDFIQCFGSALFKFMHLKIKGEIGKAFFLSFIFQMKKLRIMKRLNFSILDPDPGGITKVDPKHWFYPKLF